jgi:general secretion pathway protein D
MEVDVDKDFNLGVEWRAGDQTGTHDEGAIGTFLGSGGMGPGGSYNIIDQALSFPDGFSVGVIGAGIKIGSAVFPTLGAVIRAYQKDSDVNILSTPQILTTDNEEAQITVGENVPYLIKEETPEGTDRDYSTYEYKDVGVSLKITPQINQERFVRLKIFQEVKSLKEGSEAYKPTTLTRTADTTVIVQDKNTVVIGGMIGETTDNGSYKVPLLGDIPGLGWLFRSTTKIHNKTNLFIFLTPHIIENPVEAAEVYNEKKGYMNQIEEGAISMYESKARTTQDMRFCDIGYSYLQAKDYDNAGDYYEKALAINPDNPYAVLNMGVIYQEKGEDEKAIEMYNRVISLNPDQMAVTSTDPMQKGKSLTDIARDNLDNMGE